MREILDRLGFVRHHPGDAWIDRWWGRLALVAAAGGAFVAAFFPLYATIGVAVCALSLLPVVVIAWLVGSFGGLLAGVAALPVNAGLLTLVGEPGWSVLLDPATIEGSALIIVVGAVVGLLRDLGTRLESQIREARRVQTALRDREIRFRTLFEETRDGVCILDADGEFQEVNRALCELLGYSERELLRLDLREILDEPGTLDDLREEIAGTGSLRNRDVTLATKGGEERHCFLTALIREDEAGELLGYEAIIHDVTERKRVEDQLRHMQRIDAMGQLTGGVAHDFNNILTVILSNAELVRDSVPEGDPEIRSYFDELEGAAHRGSRLIGKLLAFARKEELVLQPVDLNRKVDDVRRTLRRLLPAHIEIRLFADDAMPTVMADPGAVEQILVNLATNARDAMPRGGVLWIHVTRTSFEERDRATHGSWVVPGDYVCVAVSDSGMGMDPETRERIFEPFYTTKSPGEGTGLGMAVIYGLVKQHRGFIHVYSEKGYGTTVKVYFPVEAGAAKVEGDGSDDARALIGDETVVVADDEASLRNAARRGLEKLGYTVLTAADGREALELIRSRGDEVDVVVTDLVMPHIGGDELLRAIERETPGTDVVVMSGYAGPGSVQGVDLGELRERDDVGFIEKPWTVPHLARTIRSLVDRPRDETRRGSRSGS